MRRIGMLPAFAVAASCMFGMTDEKFIPARSPHGVESMIRTTSSELRGELIEAQDAGLVVLSTRIKSRPRGQHTEKHEWVLRFAPYPSIRYARFNQIGEFSALRGDPAPLREVRERLRLVSRFPYGMSPEVLAELLQAHGQTTLAGIEP